MNDELQTTLQTIIDEEEKFLPSSGIISGYCSDTDITLFPPMAVTYRLAGVDGEATEDKVSVGV